MVGGKVAAMKAKDKIGHRRVDKTGAVTYKKVNMKQDPALLEPG